MQITNSTNTMIQRLFARETEQTKAVNSAGEAEKTAETKLPMGSIAGRYDLTNISPREVDRLAHELNDNGHISTQDFMILLTRGAEFMQHMPNADFSEEELNQKSNLITDFQNSLKMSRSFGDNTEGLEHLLETLKEVQERGEEERNAPAPGGVRLSSATMVELLSEQEA